MARPCKREDYVVQRIADLFRFADGLSPEQFPLSITLGERRVLMRDIHDIHRVIGEALCEIKPAKRPYILKRIADALKKKWELDEIAKVRVAVREAAAEYLPAKIKPTFAEVQKKYKGRLDRRAVKAADCSLRPTRKR